jgi:transcriptional regulator with XRE-family HTH domain
MSLQDFGDKFKAKTKKKQDTQGDKPYDFDESYRLRAKMVGVLLRDARVSVARTVEDCARLLNVLPTQIESWEFGDETPTLPQLELLAYYLDVPVSHFWSLETLKISRGGREDMQPEYINLRNRMIGALLRQARETSGLSLEDLGKLTNLPVERINAYELGELAPPIHELSTLSSGVKQNLSYFLESTSQIGELLVLREAWKHFSDLPEEVRAFAADPLNIGFIHIAVMFSKMPADQLRQVGASILDITM